MSTPLTNFEQNFRSAETLLKVYRLLKTTDGPSTDHLMMQGVRELLMASQDEELILLINELFLGVVRQNADVRPAMFKEESLCMLLRQSVVAACSALDVYFPEILKVHLPLVLKIKQRNFIPTDKTVKDFLRGFHLTLEDSLRLINEQHPENILGDLFVEFLKDKTLSNSQGVAVSLLILGVEEPWGKIAHRLGQSKEALSKQFNGLIARRNDIVHRGDHDPKDPESAVQDIQYSWTSVHVGLGKNVVYAADEFVNEQIKSLNIATEVLDNTDNG